jgi:hypothetical protein
VDEMSFALIRPVVLYQENGVAYCKHNTSFNVCHQMNHRQALKYRNFEYLLT